MTSPFCRAALLSLTAGLILPMSGIVSAETPIDPVVEKVKQMEKELLEVEGKLDQLYRRVPFCDPEEEERSIREWTEKAVGLSAFALKPAGSERLRLADGRPMPVKLSRQEISGNAPYEKVDDFLRRLALRNQLTDLEMLRVEAEDGKTVSFTARLVSVCFQEADEEKREWKGIEEAVGDLLARKRATHLKLIELTEHSKPARLVQALAAFERETGKRTVALTRIEWGQEVVLEGVTLGAEARDGLEPALEKAGFRTRRVQTSPADACETFFVTARLDEREHSSQFVFGNGLFDRNAAFCDSTLALRLRDIDLVHAFFVLNDLTSESFFVDADVKGKLSVDLEHATLEKTLDAVSSSGVVVGPGPLRRVSRGGSRPAAPSQTSYTGETISVLLEDIELASVVCALGRLPNLQSMEVRTYGGPGIATSERNPQYKVLVPRSLQGRTSIFSGHLPWDQVLDGLLASVGLTSVLDENGLFVGSGTETSIRSQADAVDACQVMSSVRVLVACCAIRFIVRA